MTQDPRENIEALVRQIVEDEDEEGLRRHLTSARDDEERFALLDAAMELEAYGLVMDFVSPMTDVNVPGQDSRPWALRAYVHYYRDEVEDAQEAFNTALELSPRDTRALLGRALVYREMDFIRASDLDLEKAMMLVQDITATSEDEEGRAFKAELYNVKASFALEDENTEVAQEALLLAGALCPDDPSFHLDLARLQSLEGRVEQALETVCEAIERDGLLMEGFILKSHIEAALGRVDDALATARTAVVMDDEEPYSLVQLASVLMLAGRLEEVIKTCDKAISLDPDIPDSHHLKASALGSLGRQDEISAQAHAAFEELADLPQFMYGDRFDPYENAADTLDSLSQMDPSKLMNIADQLFSSGQLPEALRPMMEGVMSNLPQLMEQMPGLLEMMPPGFAPPALQQRAEAPLPAGPSLSIIPGGKSADED